MLSEKEFNALLVQYRPYVISQVARHGFGWDTEEVVQDVMLQACQSRRNFEPARGTFVSWLYWQVRSCVQLRRQRHSKRRDISYSMEYHENGDPVTDVSVMGNQHDHLELRETVEAIYEMKPQQAHVILQRAVGVTLEELAGTMGLTRQRIEQVHASARKSLAKKMNRIPVMMGAL